MATYIEKVKAEDTYQIGDDARMTVDGDGDLAIAGDMEISGAATFNDGITLGAGDDLIGSSTSDITFNTNKFTVAGATGNTVVAGTLEVGGDTTVGTGATLEVTDDGGLSINSTAVTSTAAELNFNDSSAQTENITAGAISVTSRITILDTTAGATLYTLAAPDASMLGQTKIISFGTDNGDATLTLTNVQGGSAATTCTWANVGEELVLIAGVSKWNVISEGGVVLS